MRDRHTRAAHHPVLLEDTLLARIRKSAEHEDSGFTLIELLVVMIIIGILAAIAIPAFLSQKHKAKSTSAKSDVSTIGKELASYFVDESAVPAAASATAFTYVAGAAGAPGSWTFGDPQITGKLSAGNEAVLGSMTSSTAWCVTVWNTQVDGAAAANPGSATWSFHATNGLKRGTC